jgi:hypothetical protein
LGVIATIVTGTISSLVAIFPQTIALLGLPQLVISNSLKLIAGISAALFAFLAILFTLMWAAPVGWVAEEASKWIRWVALLCVASLIVTAASSYFLVSFQPSVQIVDPASNSTVNPDTIVYGSASNVQSGQTLWLLLYDPVLRLYYPQAPPVTIQPNGKWTDQLYIGSANDAGKEYGVTAVLADQSTNDFFLNYTNTGISTGNWTGITPEQYQASGASLCQLITVTRANSSSTQTSRSPSPSPSPTPTPTSLAQVNITSPSNDSTVNQSATIQGTAQGLANNQTLWIVVVPESATRTIYYPVDAPITVQSDGTWSKLANVGSSQDVGKPFDILVVQANQSANTTFANYIATGKSTGNYPGLPSLPGGATVVANVTETRT